MHGHVKHPYSEQFSTGAIAGEVMDGACQGAFLAKGVGELGQGVLEVRCGADVQLAGDGDVGVVTFTAYVDRQFHPGSLSPCIRADSVLRPPGDSANTVEACPM